MPHVVSAPRRGRLLLILLLFLFPSAVTSANAGQKPGGPPASATGAELFLAGCAGCHGPDGAGMPDSTVGFQKPSTFPDFSDCASSTPEAETSWYAVIHDGGRARGFSRIMPAFGDLLTSEQITKLVKHLRSLCRDKAWPLGDLNLPRPLNTEKPFPESESVITTTIDARHPHDLESELAYEQRLGLRDQLEVSIPFSVMHNQSDTSIGGIGDVGIGLKHVLFSSRKTGSIGAVQGVVKVPSGNKDKDLGAGTTVFEMFGAFAQLLPSRSFLQAQGGTEQPHDTMETPRTAFARVAVGKMLFADGGLGRMWTPMVEFLANHDFEDAAPTLVDIVPQVQFTINRRQHVRASLGVQVPVNHRTDRGNQVGFYLLWDWFDGGLFSGWK